MTKQTFTVGQVLTAAQMTSLQQTAMGGGSTTAKVASYVLVAADAGTVVQMNAAGATTITVNTALFAAGDSVQIQNVGAGVCTVTAGTATVSTSATLALKQYDAGTLYFNTTSAAIFFAVDAADGMTNPMTTTGDIIYSSSGSTPARLGIGTTGQVLNVAAGLPAWATATSGGMTLLSTTALTGASTITISSISGSYKNLYVLIRDNSQAGAVRFNASTSLYFGIQMYANGATVTTTGESAAGNRLTAGAAPTGTANMSMTFLVNDYAGTVAMKPLLQYGIMSTGPGEMPLISIGGLATTSAITSIAVVSDSGNWTAGEVLIYGVS